ncbi:MAG: hypothetical protein ACK4XK_08585 [Casimicrobiaceae bacterium]
MDTDLLESADLGRTPVSQSLSLASGVEADEGEIKALRELERLGDRVAAARLVF